MCDFISKKKYSDERSLYFLANYNNDGFLINVYNKKGIYGVRKVLNRNDIRNFMNIEGDFIPFNNDMSSTSLYTISDTQFEERNCVKSNNQRTVCWKIGMRGSFGESLLHVLIISNTKVHTTIAKLLLSLYHNLVHDVFESEQYNGVSALHLAIAYKNEELIDLILEYGANVHQRATGTFFMPRNISKFSFEMNRYFGEYPLSWAASINDKRVYDSLINYGADPNATDTFGNMVLHVIVANEKLMIYGSAVRHHLRPAKNNILNNDGLTPLALACVLGKSKIFREIIELSCQEYWTYSITMCCCYPLNVVDSMRMEGADNDGRSALSIILEGNKNEHLEMIKGGVIQKLLEEKWKTFGHRQFLVRIFRTLLHLLTLSIAIFLRPSKILSPECEDVTKKILRHSAEIITCLNCLRHIIIQIREFINNGNFNLITFSRKSLPRFIYLLSNIFIMICLISRLLSNTFIEELFLIFALPCSWFFLMFFAAAVRLTGPFISMIRYMILEDMRQFSIIYLVFLYGFSQAFYFLLKSPLNTSKSSNHGTYHQSWMDLFKMTLGAHEYEELRNSYYHWFTQIFFVLFMILMPILLLNMLIAMMGNTYALVISQSEREWTMQWAKILLELERALSKKEMKKFLNQYTININMKSLNEPEKSCAALMVIKRMIKSKAKQRKEAVANWKKLQSKMKNLMLIVNKDSV